MRKKKVSVPLYHFSITDKRFDELCREEGIPVREDYSTDETYEQAREKTNVRRS